MTQPESERQTPDTTTAGVTVRSPTVRAFDIDATTSATSSAQKADAPKVSIGSKPVVESVAVASPEKPAAQRSLATVVVDVLTNLGSSPQPDPTAADMLDDVPETARTAETVSDNPSQRQPITTLAGTVSPITTNGQLVAQTILEGPPVAAVAVNSSPTVVTNPLAASTPSVTTPTAVEGVVVGQSTLTIPCGPGYDVPADWYFPTGADPPTGLIWLQHGFLAQGPWYSTTAATLAKETNSIVVAPSITSNFLQCDGCWLNGDPMERAVASMLVDRTELTESARQAAGLPITLPNKFVLVGHSAGGGFAVAVAGFLAGTPALQKLAGVVMFDGVALNDSMTTALAKIPNTVPVYQIAAPSYLWNNFGSGTAQLLEARPRQFTGFQLAGGSHVDSMRGNAIIDFAAQLLTGFSPPGNFQAVETLATGWIKDMYTGGHAGIYGNPGQTIKIGKATATSLPTPPTWFTPIERVIRSVLSVFERFLFGSFNHPTTAASDRIAA